MTERELNIGQLFREFRDWRNGRDDTIEPLLAELQAHSDRFARLIAPSGADRMAVFARRLKSLDTSTVYPLLLFLASLPPAMLPRDQLERTITDLESYLVRRVVGGLTAKNYNKFFLGLLVKAKRAATDGASVPEAIRVELLRSPDRTSVWPSDADFRKAWLGNAIYVKSRADRAAMLLRAIEESLRTARNEAITLPPTLTVEHLLPQKPAMTNYPYASSMPLDADETPEHCRARMTHTIGNLTLLTQSLNASVSNGPFPDKCAAIVEDSDLRLNAWLRAGAPSAWSESNILDRSIKLFENALKIWPKSAASG